MLRRKKLEGEGRGAVEKEEVEEEEELEWWLLEVIKRC